MTSNETLTENKSKDIKREGISAVWLVPLIAVLFGGWLAFKAISEKGAFINIQFESATGLAVGKTEVRFKGLTVGKVTAIEISPDITSVNVEVEMVPNAEKFLTDKASFWLVTADVSYQGVKGLDTLLSGSYIGIQPDIEGKGTPQTDFVALEKAPPLSYDTPGLHLTLKAKTLGSLAINSILTFKKMQVGYVSNYQYNEQSEFFEIDIFIEPKFAHLVKGNTRFWNASGVNVSGSLTSGLKVRTESIASIIGGGIAFDTSEYEDTLPRAKNGDVYTLYSDYEDAEMAHEIELTLSWNSGIDIGSSIMYQGLLLGKVKSFKKVDPKHSEIVAVAKINPRVKPYLTENTAFYVVSPKLDLSGVSNLNSVAFGTYIALIPSNQGKPTSSFSIYAHRPAYSYTKPGLHLVLEAQEIGSLHQGTGVFYKQQKVGTIQAIEGVGPDDYLVHIHIEPAYENYVDKDSKFWNASGVKIEGGLQDLDINVQSMQTLLAGGIAFDKGREENRKQPNNGDQFKLFNDDSIAKEREIFALKIKELNGIDINTRIIFRGEKIGSIHSVRQTKDGVVLQAGILPDFDYILKENTVFWLIKPNLSLSGLADTTALFGGAYISLSVGEGEESKEFAISSTPPAKHYSADGLQLKLSSDSGNVVSPGSPISYRGIAVGQVDNVALDEDGQQVTINLTIDTEFQHLITHFTRFYNASGMMISGGITDLTIKSESADAMLRGGISFYNTPYHESDNPVAEGSHFTLFNSVKHAKSAGVAIQVNFKNAKGLKPDLKIKYQEHEIGFVERVEFNNDDFSAKVFGYLNDNGLNFAVSGTKFWLAQAEVGLVGNKNLGDILSGGFIGALPSLNSDSTEQTVFEAEGLAPVVQSLPFGLNLKLTTAERGSLNVGDPILYRQIKVGSIIGVGLDDNSSGVNVFINIDNNYSHLVTADSQFWNSSGIEIDAGVFSGVNITSESLETLLSGGISFATPEDDAGYTVPSQGYTFELNESFDSDWKTWKPIINR